MATIVDKIQSIITEKNRKLIPSNLKENVSLFGVTGTQKDTSDATATSGDLRKDSIAYVKNAKVTGDLNIPKKGLTNLIDLSSITYTQVSGYDYTFELNQNGYYESNNKGIDSSQAVIQFNFTALVDNAVVAFDCINYVESNYDYGIIGRVDQNLTGTSGFKSFKGNSKEDPEEIMIDGISAGEHFIQFKFHKDSSTSENNDSFQFKFNSKHNIVNYWIQYYTSENDMMNDSSQDEGTIAVIYANGIPGDTYRYSNGNWVKHTVDTSDATATSEDIVDGKIAYVNNTKIIGNAVLPIGVENIGDAYNYVKKGDFISVTPFYQKLANYDDLQRIMLDDNYYGTRASANSDEEFWHSKERIVRLDNDRFFIARSSTEGVIRASILTVGEDRKTLVNGDTYEVGSGYINKVIKLSENSVFILNSDDSTNKRIKGIVCTISSNTVISSGTNTVINSIQRGDSCDAISCKLSDETIGITLVYVNTDYKIYNITIKITGTSISVQSNKATQIQLTSHDSNYLHIFGNLGHHSPDNSSYALAYSQDYYVKVFTNTCWNGEISTSGANNVPSYEEMTFPRVLFRGDNVPNGCLGNIYNSEADTTSSSFDSGDLFLFNGLSYWIFDSGFSGHPTKMTGGDSFNGMKTYPKNLTATAIGKNKVLVSIEKEGEFGMFGIWDEEVTNFWYYNDSIRMTRKMYMGIPRDPEICAVDKDHLLVVYNYGSGENMRLYATVLSSKPYLVSLSVDSGSASSSTVGRALHGYAHLGVSLEDANEKNSTRDIKFLEPDLSDIIIK